MIKFENIEYLILLLLIIPAYCFYFFKLKKIKNLCIYTGYSKNILKKLLLRAVFFSLAWCCIVIALACPLYGSKTFSVHRKGLSVIFVMDISKSMTVKDVHPDRLTAGKYFADFLTKKYEQNAFGLVIAKGDGILAVPLTFEHTAVSAALKNISYLSMASSGTNLESGVMKAIQSFNDSRGNFKVIILITDGEETKGSLKKAAEIIGKSEIVFIVAGIGTQEGGSLTSLDEHGNEFIKRSTLNENFLREIVNIAGENAFYVSPFSYSNVFDTSMDRIFNMLNLKNEGKEKIISVREPVKRNFEFSLLAFIFFCLGVLSYYEKQKY